MPSYSAPLPWEVCSSGQGLCGATHPSIPSAHNGAWYAIDIPNEDADDTLGAGREQTQNVCLLQALPPCVRLRWASRDPINVTL